MLQWPISLLLLKEESQEKPKLTDETEEPPGTLKLKGSLDVRGEAPNGGSVTETVRSGFLHHDQVLRHAEVRLNGSARVNGRASVSAPQ